MKDVDEEGDFKADREGSTRLHLSCKTPVDQALLFHDKILCGFNANVYQQAKHNPMMREIVLFFCKYRIERFANTKEGEI